MIETAKQLASLPGVIPAGRATAYAKALKAAVHKQLAKVVPEPSASTALANPEKKKHKKKAVKFEEPEEPDEPEEPEEPEEGAKKKKKKSKKKTGYKSWRRFVKQHKQLLEDKKGREILRIAPMNRVIREIAQGVTETDIRFEPEALKIIREVATLEVGQLMKLSTSLLSHADRATLDPQTLYTVLSTVNSAHPGWTGDAVAALAGTGERVDDHLVHTQFGDISDDRLFFARRRATPKTPASSPAHDG